jgi:hypothetical protein
MVASYYIIRSGIVLKVEIDVVEQNVGQTILAAAGFEPALGRGRSRSEPPGKAAAGKIACPTSQIR